MQTVKFIYGGSATRKLTVSGRNPVILSGDNDSTQFNFTFPDSYKDYTKTIIWDFSIPTEDGIITNPTYIMSNDSFTIPYAVTANNAGKQVSFVISISTPHSDYIETSLPYPVYISRAYTKGKPYLTNDVLSQLSNRAFVSADYELKEDASGQIIPTITFDTLAGTDDSKFTLSMSSLAYLNESGKIPDQFLPTSMKLTLWTAESYEGLKDLTDAHSPDMAIITAGDEAGDIYILKDDGNWTPIYLGSEYRKLDAKVDELTAITQDSNGIVIGKTELQSATVSQDGLMTQGQVSQLDQATADTSSLKTRVQTVEGKVGVLEPKVETNSNNISSLTSKVDTNTSDIDSIKTGKQDKLTAGKNITIENDTISATADPLKPATATELGGVKVGAKLAITDDGTLSVSGLQISDVSELQGALDGKATIDYVDEQDAKKQDKLTVASGQLNLTEDTDTLSIDSNYVSSKLKKGTNISLDADAEGNVTINATGELATAEWGKISGEIQAQDDLINDSVVKWYATHTYAVDAMVSYSGKIYVSLQNDNIGNIPTDTAYWAELSPEPETTVYTQAIGDGQSKQITVTHNLGTKDVLVALRKADGSFIDTLATAISDNQIEFSFTTAPASEQYTAIISKG